MKRESRSEISRARLGFSCEFVCARSNRSYDAENMPSAQQTGHYAKPSCPGAFAVRQKRAVNRADAFVTPVRGAYVTC